VTKISRFENVNRWVWLPFLTKGFTILWTRIRASIVFRVVSWARSSNRREKTETRMSIHLISRTFEFKVLLKHKAERR